MEEGRYQIRKASFISASALAEIKERLRGRLTKPGEEITDKDLNGLIDEIGTEWATRQGNWPKRFAKVIKNRLGERLDNNFLSIIGKIARESCVEHTGRDLIITKQFDWIPGTYGDRGSCFWGSRAGAKIILQNNGGMALLIHGPNDVPLARAWCVPYGSSYIVFNCYTVGSCSITLTTFARAMSDIFNFAYYRNIDLTCRGVNCGPLWINHHNEASFWEGGRAYIIGSPQISTVEKVDLDYALYCSNCHEECRREAYVDSGDVLCGECKASAIYCRTCGRRVRYEDTVSVGENLICQNCYERYYDECSACFRIVQRGELQDESGRRYCEDCFERHGA